MLLRLALAPEPGLVNGESVGHMGDALEQSFGTGHSASPGLSRGANWTLEVTWFNEPWDQAEGGVCVWCRPHDAMDSSCPQGAMQDVEIRTNAALYLPQISDLLNRVPRQMLLLLKTNDLLRGIETVLQTRASSSSFLNMSRCCTRAIARHVDGVEGLATCSPLHLHYSMLDML
ncbi:hypothetical protein NFI96_005878 [Prochilodus magdalenae]|nr:hypothetical protein NFI96_005878 [Prochilodus magdalenae]